MKTTKNQIEALIKRLCEVSGEFNNREAALAAGKDHFISYEEAAVYGGCRLIAIKTEGGGHWGVLWVQFDRSKGKKIRVLYPSYCTDKGH